MAISTTSSISIHALDITTCAGIAVPVPSAPYVLADLQHPHGQAERAQPVEHVEPSEACPDYYGIDALS